MDTNTILTQARQKALMNKWNKRLSLVESVSGKMDIQKRAALAQTLENTQRLVESTTTVGVGGDQGTYKRFALDMVCAVIPNLISHDVVSVQPVENRVGMVNYIEYKYSKKGSIIDDGVFASPFEYKSNKNYTNNKIAVVEMKSESNTVEFDVDIAGDTLHNTLTAADIQSITIIPANGKVATIEDLSDKVTVSNGKATYTHSDGNIPAGAQVVVRYNLEAVPAVAPELSIGIKNVPIVCEPRKLRATYGLDAAFELQKEYGQDIEALLASQASAEIAHEIDMEITDDLCSQASLTIDAWNKIAPIGVSLPDHYESFYARLVEGSNKIYEATHKVRANFVVCGLNVASVIEVMRNFKSSGATTVVGPYFMGTLGQFKVYVNPDYDPDEYVLGYKGSTLFDAGYIYAPYMPIVTTNMVMLDDFVGRKGWATMYGKKMISNKMYAKGTIVASNDPALVMHKEG